MVTSAWIVLPKGNPNFRSLAFSCGVTRRFLGNLFLRIWFSALRYWTCRANSPSVDRTSRKSTGLNHAFLLIATPPEMLKYAVTEYLNSAGGPRKPLLIRNGRPDATMQASLG
jgi:hypothetical protein